VSLLGIHLVGSPVLRKETTPVAVFDDALQTLIDDMFETMYAAKGIGLAAPQVGRMERLTVIHVPDTDPLVLINPRVVSETGSATAEEGCLSMPEVYADVKRPEFVVVEALDRHGAPFTIESGALLGRCLQHEIDHLHGKLFTDYLGIFKKRAAMAQWDEERRRFPSLVRQIQPPHEIAQHQGEQEL